MGNNQTISSIPNAVTLWLDPVCPFSWNTARWLSAAAEKAGFDIEWNLMNLAVLNEGRERPAPQQARMNDSRRVGRLMVALRSELGARAVSAAYLAFAEQYFDRSSPVDAKLAEHVVRAVGARNTTAAALGDTSLDAAVAQSHQASQEALGDTGGSPMITIGGRTAFGPVLTGVPAPEETLDVFDAVAALISTPQFSQLQRPRAHG